MNIIIGNRVEALKYIVKYILNVGPVDLACGILIGCMLLVKGSQFTGEAMSVYRNIPECLSKEICFLTEFKTFRLVFIIDTLPFSGAFQFRPKLLNYTCMLNEQIIGLFCISKRVVS